MSQGGLLSDVTSAGGDIETLTADAGGAVGPDAFFNVTIVGGNGIATAGDPATNTITITATASGVAWSREAGAAVTMVVDHGYINTNAGLTTFTLPLTASFGDTIKIIGEGAGGWTIAQNAGQSIQFGNLATTVGVGGSLASSNQFDTVKITCRVNNTTWHVERNVGVLNVV